MSMSFSLKITKKHNEIETINRRLISNPKIGLVEERTVFGVIFIKNILII